MKWYLFLFPLITGATIHTGPLVRTGSFATLEACQMAAKTVTDLFPINAGCGDLQGFSPGFVPEKPGKEALEKRRCWSDVPEVNGHFYDCMVVKQ